MGINFYGNFAFGFLTRSKMCCVKKPLFVDVCLNNYCNFVQCLIFKHILEGNCFFFQANHEGFCICFSALF